MNALAIKLAQSSGDGVERSSLLHDDDDDGDNPGLGEHRSNLDYNALTLS